MAWTPKDLVHDFWNLAVDGLDNYEWVQRNRQVRIRPQLPIQNVMELNSGHFEHNRIFRLLHGSEDKLYVGQLRC